MPLHVSGIEYVTLPSGAYPGMLLKVEAGTRAEYGVTDPTPDQQVPCFLWTFRIDESKLPKEIRKRIADKDDDLTIEGTDQLVMTGVNFGSQRATLTKMVRNLVGQPKLTLAEAKKIDLEKLATKRVLIVLDQVVNQETGEIRNKVVTITNELTGDSNEVTE